MRKALAAFLCVCLTGVIAQAHFLMPRANHYHHAPAIVAPATYYISASGSDSNSGTSSGSPWLTPNHTGLHCGDTILAATGTYTNTNFGAGQWGVPSSCPNGGNYFVSLICNGTSATSCNITAASAEGLRVDKSNWAIIGWQAGSTGSSCFAAAASGTQLHHIAFINDIANGCFNGGFETYGYSATPENGDYLAFIGDVAYNAAQGASECYSGFSVYDPLNYDTAAGTHIFADGLFAWGNFASASCPGHTDGNGIIADNWSGSQTSSIPFTGTGTFKNIITVGNGGAGLSIFQNSAAPITLSNITAYGNYTSADTGTWLGDIVWNEDTSTTTRSLTNSAVYEPSATSGASTALYAMYVGGTTGTNLTISGNYFLGQSGQNQGSQSNTSFSYGSNTNSNPGFQSAAVPGAPSCSAFSNVMGCMATLIEDFGPGTATGFGFQYPCTADMPSWVSDIVPSNVTASCGDTIPNVLSGIAQYLPDPYSDTSITDSGSNVWTLSGSNCLINGSNAGGNCNNVALLMYFSGAMYYADTSHNWHKWGGSSWSAISGNPRSPWFAANSAWNTPIAASPTLVSNSAAIISALYALSSSLNNNIGYWTPAVVESPPGTTTGTYTNNDFTGQTNVPWGVTQIPLNSGRAQSQAQAAATYFHAQGDTDAKLCVISADTSTAYSVQYIGYNAGGWTPCTTRANSGLCVWTGAAGNLNTGGGWWQQGSTYSTASGYELCAGIIRPDEWASGQINHALAGPMPFGINKSGLYAFPATASDGSCTGSNCLPEGSLLQLDPTLSDLTLEGLGVAAAMLPVAHALQTYGLYDMDSSSNAAISFYASLGNASTIYPGAPGNNLPWALISHMRVISPISSGSVPALDSNTSQIAFVNCFSIGGSGCPGATDLLSAQTLGTAVNSFNGYAGVEFETSGSGTTVINGLGRWIISGNSQTHNIILASCTSSSCVTATVLCTVSINASGATTATYDYATCSSPVSLSANSYYVVASQETSGGDQYYNDNTTGTFTSMGTQIASVYTFGGGTTWSQNTLGGGHLYGPVNAFGTP